MLFAARSAVALYRLLDVLPAFAGDDRIRRRFTLVPGSDFAVDTLAALDAAGARVIPWSEALATRHDLILAASPKGDLHHLRGPIALLPHGAGFNKTVAGDGSQDSASGLDPGYLLRDGRPLASLYALAHPGQAARLSTQCPPAAAHTVVVGDPTLDRLLVSRGLRDRYRAALGTGSRRLVVLTSTWGPHSLLAHAPDLPTRLCSQLPLDDYQLALVVHPNEQSEAGARDLSERLAPALASGLILTRQYEEWGAALVAADAVITDHGSTALYAAALDRPLLAAHEDNSELLPGTPMDRLLASVPRFTGPGDLTEVLAGHRPGTVRALAESAFAEQQQGQALARLREELYAQLDLVPAGAPPEPRLLPVPRTPERSPTAFAVRISVQRDGIGVERHPAHNDLSVHHLAAEEDATGIRHAQSAALLFRRARGVPAAASWTAAGWTSYALDTYPGCRTAAVILSPATCIVRRRGGSPLRLGIDPCEEAGRVFRPDPAAVLSATHAWLADAPRLPASFLCVIGGRRYRARLAPATGSEAAHEV